jgi:endonuclease/exonuclease/phosphatase family metal-dependent hydrolase
MTHDKRPMTNARIKRLGVYSFRFGCAAIVGIFAVPWALTGASSSHLAVRTTASAGSLPERAERDTLRVISLNLAHGRRDGDHQVLLSPMAIRANLDDVAAMVEREHADLVALQEADGTSFWSGRFDHVEHLAEEAKLAFFVHGHHVQGPLLSYGTAIASRVRPIEPVSHTFSASPPTLSKGLVIATYDWPEGESQQIDVVSVHLDFARVAVRQSQARQMCGWLRDRGRPLVVLGDFNCDFAAEENSLRTLADELHLDAFEPSAEQPTFPSTGERLDWILISPELEFIDYRVLPDVISDHAALVAEIRFRSRPE